MYSAKEAAEITGLSTATLRYYEKEKLLPPIARTTQKYRQYSDEDIENLYSQSQTTVWTGLLPPCGVKKS